MNGQGKNRACCKIDCIWKDAQITWQGKCEGGGLEPPSRFITRPQATQNAELHCRVRHFARGRCSLQHPRPMGQRDNSRYSMAMVSNRVTVRPAEKLPSSSPVTMPNPWAMAA